MFGFKKQTLKQKRIARRKKFLQQSIAKLTHRKVILEIEVEGLDLEIEKLHEDLKNTLKKEVENG